MANEVFVEMTHSNELFFFELLILIEYVDDRKGQEPILVPLG
jgi:hypothetical protein